MNIAARSYKFILPSLILFIGAGVNTLADEFELVRTSAGKPDLSGYYNAATLTPVERPEAFGDKLWMTQVEANAVMATIKKTFSSLEKASSGDRGAPKAGGDGDNRFGGGGVGGYNAFWIDPGSSVNELNGKFRTSVIYDPVNGRKPKPTMAAMSKMADQSSSFIYENDGTASWLERKGPGPFDGPESLGLNERCLVGFTGAAPTLPSLYNNFKRIIQTETHVVLVIEMVHDARVVRLNAEHGPSDLKSWFGDSVGHWEGDTLVVDTINFRETSMLSGADENLHLTERFTALDNGDVIYNFTVVDETAWDLPWSGEYTWKRSSDVIYEYACHEGNYAMGNILRGARLLESEYVAVEK